MSKEVKQSFLGTGWSFPPTFNAYSQRLEMVSEKADIEQSLYLLFSTLPGERIMNPAYGCDLQQLVFDSINATLANEIIAMINYSVLHHEPRIIVEEIQVRESAEQPGLIYIYLDYTIRQTNSRSNMVYPFYFQEGTNLSVEDYLGSS